jgi:hypothetical protein
MMHRMEHVLVRVMNSSQNANRKHEPRTRVYCGLNRSAHVMTQKQCRVHERSRITRAYATARHLIHIPSPYVPRSLPVNLSVASSCRCRTLNENVHSERLITRQPRHAFATHRKFEAQKQRVLFHDHQSSF